MEDEEDIQSQNSGESGSPATSRSDGRITVTVASVPPSSQGSLTLALPSQQPMQQQQQQQLLQQSSRSSGKSGGGGGGGGGGSGGREDCWSEGATSVLIDAWGERYLELSRGNLKQNHWKDVADIVGSLDNSSKTPKTDIQCKNRIDTVKKKYKMEKAKIAAGGGPSKWPFYERLDRLIGSTAKLPSSSGGGAGSSGGMTPSQRVPMGIPLGARSNPNLRHQQQQHHLQKHKPPIRKRPVASDSESEPELSPDSADDFPPVTYERNKRPRSHNQNDFGGGGRSGTNTGKDAIMEKRGGKDKNIGNSVKDLAWAIMKFGEAYEQAESSKLQQLVDMEKQRMKFAKELEVQRMQFFMKTQLELSQLHNNHHRRSGNGRSNHHRSSINTAATNNNDHSDCSN